jgi:RNA polymerase sigma factor (sigma-70 family)
MHLISDSTQEVVVTETTRPVADYREEARRLVAEYVDKVIAAFEYKNRRDPDRLRWALGTAVCAILRSDRSVVTLATARSPLAYLITCVRFAFQRLDHFGADARLLRKAERIDSEDVNRAGPWVSKDAQSPLERAELRESAAMARKYARKLPWRQRAVFALYYYRGLNVTEIGRRLGLSCGAVFQLRRAALMRLRSMLEGAA